MANYDSKLGEWFKLVEQQEQELRAKKNVDVAPAPNPPPPPASTAVAPERVTAEARAADPPVAAIAMVPAEEIMADARLAERPAAPREPEIAPANKEDDGPSLFDEKDAPAVEDFFSFLNRSRGETAEAEPVYEVPRDQASLNLSEGTGEPRPISNGAPTAVPPREREPEFVMPPSRRLVEPPAVVRTEAVQIPPPAPKPKPAQPASEPPAEAVQAKWDRMPKHLQTLFGAADEEVAQHSYKTFKETRGALIQRLLDPVISLEEAARILDVCPTTVRRYTNRGALKHLRTAGNQRRFRLSDVLVFMESGGKRAQAAEGEAQS